MSELQGQLNYRDAMWNAEEDGAVKAEAGTAEMAAREAAKAVVPEDKGQAPADEGRTLEIIAAEINAAKQRLASYAIAAALEIGERLCEAKNKCPKGRWTEWLQANVFYSERKAQDLMRFYGEYGHGAIPQAVAQLDYTKALQLLALPEGEREAVAVQAVEEGMSTRELQAEIKRLTEERQKDQVKIFELIQDGETKDRAIRREREEAERLKDEARAAGETADEMRRVSSDAAVRAEASAQRANDAIQRANETQRQLAEAQARIRELEAREPERVEVETLPQEVAEELERLRQHSPSVAAFKAQALRLRNEFGELTRAYNDVLTEVPDKAPACREIVLKLTEQVGRYFER